MAKTYPYFRLTCVFSYNGIIQYMIGKMSCWEFFYVSLFYVVEAVKPKRRTCLGE